MASITDTFVASDQIKFEGETTFTGDTPVGIRVLKNGLPVGFDGELPNLEIGGNTINIQITSTSHTVEATARTKMRYL